MFSFKCISYLAVNHPYTHCDVIHCWDSAQHCVRFAILCSFLSPLWLAAHLCDQWNRKGEVQSMRNPELPPSCCVSFVFHRCFSFYTHFVFLSTVHCRLAGPSLRVSAEVCAVNAPYVCICLYLHKPPLIIRHTLVITNISLLSTWQ